MPQGDFTKIGKKNMQGTFIKPVDDTADKET